MLKNGVSEFGPESPAYFGREILPRYRYYKSAYGKRADYYAVFDYVRFIGIGYAYVDNALYYHGHCKLGDRFYQFAQRRGYRCRNMPF